ncbi:MAG: DUF4348 domain-containing protein [Bacteroidota bacterium]
MKIIRNTVYIGSYLIFCLSCTQSEKTNEITEEQNTEQTVDLEEIESFDQFLIEFGEDSIFQKSRIEFPLSYYTFDIEDNREEYTIPESDWLYEDFTMDKEASKRKVDAYKPVVESKNSKEATYLRKGIDNGIRIEYHFKFLEDKWMLNKVLDYSN